MFRVRLPRPRETLEEKQKHEDKFFTIDEMKLLLELMELKTKQYHSFMKSQNYWSKRYFVEFQFSLGNRISESIVLRYQNIDFENGILHLRSQINRLNSKTNAPKFASLKK